MMLTHLCDPSRPRTLGVIFAMSLAACSDDDPRLFPPNLPAGAVGQPYEAEVSAEGLDGDPTWTLTGALPPGLDSEVSGGRFAISGTPVTPGSFQFLLRAEGDGEAAELLYRLVITGDQEALQITTASLPAATVGVPYQALLTAAGGSESGYAWTADGLPAGLSLRRTGAFIAQIQGTPVDVGDADVIVRVTDSLQNTATATLTLSVRNASASLQIVTPSLPGAVRGLPYEAQVTARGGSGQGYTWEADVLPQGLVIESGTPAATIRGTPRRDEPVQLVTTIAVTDSAGTRVERTYTLSVNDPPELVISPKQFPNAAVGEPYEESVQAVGGVGPFAWSLSAGSLPTDVALVASDTRMASIEGTPSQGGTFNFTLQIEDSLGATAEFPVELFVDPAPLGIVPSSPPIGTVGLAYSTTIRADGGAGPYQWSLAPGSQLPPGLSLFSSDGDEVTVFGIPSRAGVFDATVVVQDSLGAEDREDFNFVVEAPALTVTSTSVAVAIVGRAYLDNIDAVGGTETGYRWSIFDGSLPDGINLEETGTPSTLLFGVPTSTGTFDFTVEVEDSAGAVARADFTLTSTTAP